MANEIKTAQLGMPLGTAMGRLRKEVMLHLLQRLGEDNCFKCSEKIGTAEELSIDHKLPWLHMGTDLFWDLKNIAFSHRSCNRPDRPWLVKGGYNRIYDKAPDGTAWCCGCKQFLEFAKFYSNARNRNRGGTMDRCRQCFSGQRRGFKSRSNAPWSKSKARGSEPRDEGAIPSGAANPSVQECSEG